MPSFNRRQLFRVLGGLAGASAARPEGRAYAAATAQKSLAAPRPFASAYRSLGVRPLINCRGTFTIIGGSIELPEVRAAKTAANQEYVHLDELAEASGRRLAELTGAEWGMVSAGCAAAMSHATAACVAGGNPDLHVRIPNLEGFPRDEVIIPTHSRNVYDAAIRAVGVRIVEVDTPEALRLAIGPRTAMIYIFAGPANDSGPMSTEAICAIAKPHEVPVLVDAAAEILTIPNVHLQRGATLVAYSGGKYIRGPQSAGLLLGRKDLVRAAWVHSAPHHGYARNMKVGREEIVGMVVAVERWVATEHAAEWKDWIARCEHIASRVAALAGVTAAVQREPDPTLSNRSPRVTIRWDPRKLGLTGPELAKMLLDGEPRIALGGGESRDGSGESTISIVSAMMAPGDEKIVGERVRAALSAAYPPRTAQTPAAPAADVSGRWDIDVRFAAATSRHTIHLRQDGNRLEGLHRGDFLARDISGTIDGSEVTLASIVTERHGDALTYRFHGTVEGDVMEGSLDLGEYLNATWTGRRPAPKGRAGGRQAT